MKKFFRIYIFMMLAITINADDHADNSKSFPGLVSSEMFEMSDGMVMHVERRKTCNQGTVAKHFHPAAGTLDMYLMANHNRSQQAIGKHILIMNIGLKNLIGFMVASLMHLN